MSPRSSRASVLTCPERHAPEIYVHQGCQYPRQTYVFYVLALF
jgi:hypothetical protein